MANSAGIIGYGYYVPERIVSNYESMMMISGRIS
jgi:3-oxoacyl-[acyl-carrier-protein] synthase III